LGIDERGGGGVTWSAFTGSGVLSSGVGVTPGAWTFVAVTHNQANGQLRLYVDGVLKASTSSAGFGTGFVQTTVGRNPNFDTPFDGRMDNVFFANEVLTEAQIADIYARGETALVPNIAAVPAPPAIVLFAVGFLGLAASRRLRGVRSTA
jgi:hypothetical protein